MNDINNKYSDAQPRSARPFNWEMVTNPNAGKAGTQLAQICTPGKPPTWCLLIVPTPTPRPNVMKFGTQTPEGTSESVNPIPVIEIEPEGDTAAASSVSELPKVGSYSYKTQVTDANINNVSYYSDSSSSPSQSWVSQASTSSSSSSSFSSPVSVIKPDSVLNSPVGEIQKRITFNKRGQSQGQFDRRRKTDKDEELVIVNEISPPKKRPRETIIGQQQQRRDSQKKVSSPVQTIMELDYIPNTCTTMERLVAANSQGFDAQVQNSIAKFSKKSQTSGSPASTPNAATSGKPIQRISIRSRPPFDVD